LNNPAQRPDYYRAYELKIPYYNAILDRILDPHLHREAKVFKVADCPNHPANPNHLDHDPSKYY